MTMDQLREQIVQSGIEVNGLDDNMLKEVAKSLGIEVTRSAQAEVIEHTLVSGRRNFYVKTPGVEYVGLDGKKATSQPPFIPVGAVEQTIEDLKLGLAIARAKGLVK